MSKYCFDIETDNLLEDCTKVHCIVLKDINTEEVLTLSNDEAIDKLTNAELIIGHNIIKFDIPVLEKIYNFKTKAEVFDTLVATRLIWSDLMESDMKRVHSKDFPRKLVNKHSLKAWGVRLGNYKQEFETDWKEFSNEMLEYCVQDVEVTHDLYQRILGKKYSTESLKLEHDVATLISRQERYGVLFDKDKAAQLYANLSGQRDKIKKEMEETFKPKVDDTVLNSLDYPEAKLLAKYFLLEKRIGMLAEGNQAYLKLERNGRLHGTVNTNNAVTGRATAMKPNLQQVPSVSVPYGKEFRELFTVPKGKVLIGIDVSGLELRLLGHYIAKFDGGAYADIVVNGDIHTTNQHNAGLETRDQSKRFLYAWLYGAGVSKIAEVTGKTNKEAAKVKKRFLDRLPALNKLIKQVQLSAERGYLVGLDKRQIKVRNTFSSLNTLLQGAGAAVCKRWLVEFDNAVKNISGVQQLLWVHDEIQVECDEDKAKEIGELAVECIERTGKHFQLRVPLTGEYKIGNNWSETH